jgi:hypothetical protein
MMKWFGIAGGLATAFCMTMILEQVFHFPRTASGVLIGVIGIPVAAFSNGNSANPSGQSYMEFFGMTMFICSVARFLHITDIIAKIGGDSPLVTGLVQILRTIC